MPAIVVLVKHVPDTWSVKTLNPNHTLHREGTDEIIDEINEFAVEQALRIKEADPNYQVIALAMGPERADEALRKALAMGVDQAVLLSDPALAGSDILATTWALSSAIDAVAAKLGVDVQLIIAGNASSDGAAGAIPGLISEYRNIPALTNLTALTLSGNTVTGTREIPAGHLEVVATLPAIVSVTEKTDKPRFPNFKGIMAAKKAEILHLTLADTAAEASQVGAANAATQVVSATPKPAREAGDIVRGDSAVSAVVDFLASRNLI